MYVKPNNPISRSDLMGKSLRVNKKTDSGSDSFKDLLEEIDIVELSSELDPDEKRKQDLQKKQEKNQEEEVAEPIPQATLKGINRFV